MNKRFRIAMATSWVSGLATDEVAIKDYSENEGIYPQLVAQGIILPCHRFIEQGFVQFPIARLDPEFAKSHGIASTI